MAPLLWADEPARKERIVETIPLCSILADPMAYHGRNVRVSGYFIWNREVQAIADHACENIWETGPGLEPPSLCLKFETQPADAPSMPWFELFGKSIQLYYVPFTKREIEVAITVTGRVEGRSGFRTFRGARGVASGNGFCHLGQFPGVIHQISLEEWKVRVLAAQ